MPDPRDAARSYEKAVRSGDAVALRELLSEEARLAYSEADLRRLLQAEKVELASRAASVAAASARVDVRATLGTARGPELSLAVEQGEFRLSSDSALLPRPESPRAALVALGAALHSRDAGRLEVLLSEEQQVRMAERRAALLSSLLELDGATWEVQDEKATAVLPDGQVVELVREGGVWRVRALP